MTGRPRVVRAVLLIGIAALALALVAGRAAWPASRLSSPAEAHGSPVAAPPVVRRPVGTAVIDGDVFAAPEIHGDEYGLLVALITRGIDIERVDEAPWSRDLDSAVADVITTDQDQLFVFAPNEPGHPRWVCHAEIEGAMIGGGDAPSYEISVGGDRKVVQIDAPDLRFWTFGEVIVGTPTQRSAGLVASFAQPAACPVGQ